MRKVDIIIEVEEFIQNKMRENIKIKEAIRFKIKENIILVKFNNWEDKEKVITVKNKLKGTKIYIDDDLD